MEGAEIPEGEPSYAVITLPLRIPRDSHSRNPILAAVSTPPPHHPTHAIWYTSLMQSVKVSSTSRGLQFNYT